MGVVVEGIGMGPPREVVEISSDDDEEGSGECSYSPRTLGLIASFHAWLAPVPRKKTGNRGVGEDGDDDDDCVILDGDPHRPVAVADAKGRSAVGGASDDEAEIVAVKGEIACKDFPHSRHLCSDLPFSTTPHVKHCNMCYCFVCDAPAPCKYWWKGLLYEDHCHATEKETKWKTLRQAFKCKNLPAPYTVRTLQSSLRMLESSCSRRSSTTGIQARAVDTRSSP